MIKDSLLVRIPKTIFNIPAAMPNYAQIAITNICNLNCKMCFRHFLKLDIKHMDFDVFRKVVDSLKGVTTLAITGYGEPLTHPRFFDAVQYAKERGFEVQTTSNGLLLGNGDNRNQLISSGLDAISFSVESIHEENDIAHPNRAALDHIRGLVEKKRELNISTPSITLQTLMLKDREQDLFDIIEWGALTGVDRINVARFELNTLETVKRPSKAEEKEIFKEFSRLRKRYGIRIDCLQDQIYEGLQGFLYKHFKYFLGMDRRCIRLHDFIYINVEGNVNPCCAIVDYSLGNLCESDLRDIWTSKKYDIFRKNFYKFPWCSKCDFAKLKQVPLKNDQRDLFGEKDSTKILITDPPYEYPNQS